MFYYLIVVLFVGFITACSNIPPKIKYVEKTVPIYYVPKAPNVTPPVLYLTQLTSEQENDIGELAKAFNISLTQETQYACQLKLIVDAYATLASTPPQLLPTSVFSSIKSDVFSFVPGLLGTPPTLVINTDKCNKS